MGLRDKFANSFAKSKTMTAPEKKANEIIGKLLLKKSYIPIAIMIVVLIVGEVLKAKVFNFSVWFLLIIEVIIVVISFFYIKNSAKKYQNFKPYAGTLISLEKNGKGKYTAVLKQGKLPLKLQITYGGEDLEGVKRNQLIQISYNKDAKIIILVKKM